MTCFHILSGLEIWSAACDIVALFSIVLFPMQIMISQGDK